MEEQVQTLVHGPLLYSGVCSSICILALPQLQEWEKRCSGEEAPIWTLGKPHLLSGTQFYHL